MLTHYSFLHLTWRTCVPCLTPVMHPTDGFGTSNTTDAFGISNTYYILSTWSHINPPLVSPPIWVQFVRPYTHVHALSKDCHIPSTSMGPESSGTQSSMPDQSGVGCEPQFQTCQVISSTTKYQTIKYQSTIKFHRLPSSTIKLCQAPSSAIKLLWKQCHFLIFHCITLILPTLSIYSLILDAYPL